MRIIITIALALVISGALVMMYDAMAKGQCNRQLRHGVKLDEECVVEYNYYQLK